MGIPNLYDGLYKINLLPPLDLTSSSVSVVAAIVGSKCIRLNENSSILWHKKLGHISREKIERLIKNDILVDLNFFFYFKIFVACIQGKFPAKIRK